MLNKHSNPSFSVENLSCRALPLSTGVNQDVLFFRKEIVTVKTEALHDPLDEPSWSW